MAYKDLTVTLRPIEDADTPMIVKWRNQDFVRKNFFYRGPFTEEVHTNWLRTKVDTGQVAQFIILLGDSPVGSIYLRDIDTWNKKAEYGLYIGEEAALHQGVGTRAGQLILDYGFGVLGLNKIYLRLMASNVAAQKSYLKVGFHMEGHFRYDVFCDGKFEDVIFMSILAMEWNNTRAASGKSSDRNN